MSENSSHLSSEADPLRFDLPPESIGPVFQLPEQVRSKWQTWECAGPGDGNSGEDPDLRKEEPEGPQQVRWHLAIFSVTFALLSLAISPNYIQPCFHILMS
jgi:hypothetical protein